MTSIVGQVPSEPEFADELLYEPCGALAVADDVEFVSDAETLATNSQNLVENAVGRQELTQEKRTLRAQGTSLSFPKGSKLVPRILVFLERLTVRSADHLIATKDCCRAHRHQ